ncbi:sodium:calcium antiporter [Azotosporobacter soli]|uniref:sodium:calcium antiporter n=1 Tax=Azotosporobacter soli TaxID=3055040 RepID=UPI0031FE90DD
MLLSYAILLISVIVIYYSCELFVNAIEWVGKKINVSQCAIGTILAAFGTALPESVVTFMAVTFNATPQQQDIGVGAALGGPLVLGTLAYAVTGFCILLFRKQRDQGLSIQVDGRKLRHDQLWFAFIFIFKLLLGITVFAFKPLTGFLFLAAYALYFYKEMRAECDLKLADMTPLTFQPNQLEPDTFRVLLQTTLSLTLIFISSHFFVKNLELLSVVWNVSPLVVSLLLSPVATELPEILNAVIWVRQGKESLALSNISGAMMIQATVPSALGLFFTPWLFDRHLWAAGIMTLVSISYLLFTLKRNQLSPKRLLVAALFYLLFSLIFFI